MKRVMVYAYTAHNLGDDLFIEVLCQRYPHTQFFLYAPAQYQVTFQHVNNLTIIPSDRFSRKLLHLFPFTRYWNRNYHAKQCDAGIYIGGSLFMEQQGWEQAVDDFRQMLQQPVPFFVLGANFGPYETKLFKQTYDQLFDQCTDVCFRDAHSKALFPASRHIRQGRDVVLELEAPQSTHTEKNIVISVIYPSVRTNLASYDNEYFSKMAAVGERLVQEGYYVTWMSFCTEEKDDAAIEQILEQIPSSARNKMDRYLYKGDLRAAIQRVASASAVIATRFHAMILAAVYQKPVFPVIYSGKMTQVLHDLDFEGASCHVRSFGSYDCEVLLQSLHSSQSLLQPDILPAGEQFLKLDQFLRQPS